MPETRKDSPELSRFIERPTDDGGLIRAEAHQVANALEALGWHVQCDRTKDGEHYSVTVWGRDVCAEVPISSRLVRERSTANAGEEA